MARKILVLVFLGLPLLASFYLSRTSTMLNNVVNSNNIPDEGGFNGEENYSRAALLSKRKLSLIVQVRGEMANHLSLLAFAKGIQMWIHEHHPHLAVDIVGERQSGMKWKSAVGDLQQCFPNLRHLDFHGGHWDTNFTIRQQQQKEWIGGENEDKLIINRGDSDCGTKELFCLNDQLAFLRTLLDQEVPHHIAANASEADHKYSLPFIITNQLASFDVLVDQYYEPIKDWFEFDFDACCTEAQPDPDEVVFHLRNFRAEMRERNYLERGYEELTPRQLALELLGHLTNGTHVAIASRGDAYVQPFMDALTNRGLLVRRTPPNHTGVQDFCFLLKTKRELVGTMRSTYTRWAALLGQAQKVQLYSIDSEWTRRAHGSEDEFPTNLHYPWKRPGLQSRISYRIFPGEFGGD
jgi:hypothetical protein